MKFLKLWLPVFIWSGIIFYLSSLPNLQTEWGFWDLILRKLAHITEYLILTFLLYRAFKRSFDLSTSSLIFWPSVLSFLYAISDEIHQRFVPTRSGNLEDILIDAAGIVLFYIILKNVSLSKAS
jgi:VanZ family protein